MNSTGAVFMPRDLIKTLTYLSIHLTVGFTVAYAMTGSLALAGGIALVEPVINAVAFFFHEQAWKRVDARREAPWFRKGRAALA
jgi:uncharacterized membrane protein